jgi:hypothetical protein
MVERLSGKCLCGDVKFTAIPDAMQSGACHCSMCRHWSGGVFMAVSCGDSVQFDSEESLGIYQSSQWGERVFCKNCGSSLMWRSRDNKHQNVSMQVFDNPQLFEFANQYFIDLKPDNYSFANQTDNMTEAELMAMFASSPEGDDHG